MKLLTKTIHAAVAGLFFLMAVIQLNDPDPLYWFVTYGFVAAVPACWLLGYRPHRILMIATGMVLAGVLLSTDGFIDYLQSGDYASIVGSMMAAKPYVESAREFLGLMIAATGLFVYWRIGCR